MFSKFIGLMSSDMAIDLGTANTLVYVKDKGIVLNEPSVVALIRENGHFKPYAFGHEAKMMLGRTPLEIVATRPLKDGVIADFKAEEHMIRGVIKMINKGKKVFSPQLNMVICIPFGIIHKSNKPKTKKKTSK